MVFMQKKTIFFIPSFLWRRFVKCSLRKHSCYISHDSLLLSVGITHSDTTTNQVHGRGCPCATSHAGPPVLPSPRPQLNAAYFGHRFFFLRLVTLYSSSLLRPETQVRQNYDPLRLGLRWLKARFRTFSESKRVVNVPISEADLPTFLKHRCDQSASFSLRPSSACVKLVFTAIPSNIVQERIIDIFFSQLVRGQAASK